MAANYCTTLHPLHGHPTVFDPSGPLLDNSGLWHMWDDQGAWPHWTSHDLVHWQGSLTTNTTNFSGLTGAISPTPSGMYAVYPDDN